MFRTFETTVYYASVIAIVIHVIPPRMFLSLLRFPSERGQHVCRYFSFQAVSASSFSLTPCLLLFVLVSCFLPSSVLVHNVCTNFQASMQVNRNLVLPLVSKETIAIEVSIGECRASGCREIIYYQGIRVSGYQNIRILR